MKLEDARYIHKQNKIKGLGKCGTCEHNSCKDSNDIWCDVREHFMYNSILLDKFRIILCEYYEREAIKEEV